MKVAQKKFEFIENHLESWVNKSSYTTNIQLIYPLKFKISTVMYGSSNCIEGC